MALKKCDRCGLCLDESGDIPRFVPHWGKPLSLLKAWIRVCRHAPAEEREQHCLNKKQSASPEQLTREGYGRTA